MLAKATSLVSCSRDGRPTARFLMAMAVIKNLKEELMTYIYGFILFFSHVHHPSDYNQTRCFPMWLEDGAHPLRIV